MKSLLLISLLFLIRHTASAACDVFQTTDVLGTTRVLGNAVALTTQVMVMNEHSLFPGTKVIFVRNKGTVLQAQVLFRDHHTDLAFIKVENIKLAACSVPLKNLGLGDRLFLKGYQDREKDLYELQTSVKNPDSARGSIVGINSVIEIQFMQTGLIENSMSGSILTDETNSLYGILSQRSSSGTGLIIGYKTIREAFDRGAVSRKYRFNEDRKKAFYAGLEINVVENSSDRVAGNPHEGRSRHYAGNPHELQPVVAGNPHEGGPLLAGNPHEGNVVNEGDNAFVSGQSKIQGFVLAKIVDWNQFRQFFPEIADFVKDGAYLEIYSVSGKPVHSAREFLQLVETLSPVDFTDYIIRDEEKVGSENKRTQNLDQLFAMIRTEHGDEFADSIEDHQKRLTILVQRSLENIGRKRRNIDQLHALTEEWSELRRKLSERRHSELLMKEIFKFQGLIYSFDMW